MRGVTFFTAAETAACLRVRHAICNYLVVVLLRDRPSAYSVQYTCWSGGQQCIPPGAVCGAVMTLF